MCTNRSHLKRATYTLAFTLAFVSVLCVCIY